MNRLAPVTNRISHRRWAVSLRRFLSKNIPACLSFHPSFALGFSTHSPTMREKARLEYE